MFSKISLLFTKRSTVALYALGALLSLFVLVTGTAQILISYHNGEGFDVTPGTYYSEAIFYLPFFITNGVLLRLLLERWRILRRSKTMTHVAEYGAPKDFSPALAGLLIDNDIRTEEVVATLYDLAQRGILVLDDNAIRLAVSESPVTSPEKVLVSALFSRGSIVSLSGASAGLFLSASDAFRKAMLLEMRQRALLPAPLLSTKGLRRGTAIIFAVASYASIVLFVYLIKSPFVVLTVQYPRFPMSIGQPILAIAYALVALSVAVSGFFSKTFTTSGRDNWRFAAGYRLYIETVFRSRLERSSYNTYDKDMKTVLPYAIALGVYKQPVNDMLRKLGL